MADALHAVMLAAADLKAAAPQEFERLVTAIKTFEERCRDDLSAAEPNVIFPVQGRAQVITQLRQKLENCTRLRSEFETRRT
jgi:hypothetical protein